MDRGDGVGWFSVTIGYFLFSSRFVFYFVPLPINNKYIETILNIEYHLSYDTGVFVWYSVRSYILHMTYLPSVLIDEKCVTTIAMDEEWNILSDFLLFSVKYSNLLCRYIDCMIEDSFPVSIYFF